MKRFLLLLLLLGAVTARAQRFDTVRVCTWNVKNFDADLDPTRTAAVESVIRALHLDLIIINGVTSEFEYTALRVPMFMGMQPRAYSASFRNGENTHNAIFYDPFKLRHIQRKARPIHTKFRDINESIFVVLSSRDTLHILGCQLRAGNTKADSILRAEETALIRQRTDSVPPRHLFIVMGDLNIYTSAENAYQILTHVNKNRTGHLFDPVSRSGTWHADSAPNDRFSFVLLSRHLMRTNYIRGSYTTFGNDGRHFNNSINALPNTAVPDSIAQALHVASDRLPVYLDLKFVKRPPMRGPKTAQRFPDD